MFQKSSEERLSEWKTLRVNLDKSSDPLTLLSEFWSHAPMIPYNHHIDQYNFQSWPTPWDIIVENKYDDFTVALMMAQTLILTEKFANSRIEVRTMVDETRTKLYNLVYVDDTTILNYDKWKSITSQDIPETFFLENSIDIVRPR